MRNKFALLYKPQIGNLEEANILVLQEHFWFMSEDKLRDKKILN